MTDSIFDTLAPPAPTNVQAPPSDSDVDSLTAQATAMANEGGPGKNADKAQAWLLDQMGKRGVQPTTSIFNDAYSSDGNLTVKQVKKQSIPVSPFVSVEKGDDPGGLSVDDVLKQAPVTLTKPNTPTIPTLDQSTAASRIMDAFSDKGDTRLALSNIQAYFHDFSQKHQLVDGGAITPEQKAAAKVLGMDIGDFPIWGPIYKMTPDERNKADQTYQESLGLHPQQTLDRINKTTSAKPEDLKEFDPYGKFINDSLLTQTISHIANPEQANTKRYQEVQEMVQSMDAVNHPDKYNPKFVKYSADKILAYKKMNETGTVQQLKDFVGEIKKNPVGQAKAMAGGIASEPELLLAPEAKLGTMLAGPREAAAGAAAARAAQLGGLAGKVADASRAVPSVAEAAERASSVYGNVASRAIAAQRTAAAVRHVGDTLGSVGAGAGINTLSAAADQYNQQGYVQKGSLEVPALTGAAFGAVAHAIGGHGSLEEDLANRAQPKPTVSGDSQGPDVNAGRKPGEPLHPDTPISKDGNVPYFGGVDANMDRIHLHEDAPDQVEVTNRSGKKINIPVKQTVGYHEAVEAPLMHMEGPIGDDTLSELQRRIGPDKQLPPKTIQKLKEGKSLVYTNPDHEDTDPGAHEIATWAENHMVRTLYDTEPKVYQDALKPYIKEVSKASQKPGAAADIPNTLDTKPYDDVGEGAQLEGKGARPPVDGVQPGAEENADNKQGGKIDPRLLATGVVAGGGALAGSLMPGDKEKNALLGGVAGLATSALFWGDGVGATGRRLKEGGMFAGPVSRTWKGTDVQMAEKLEKIGKSPDEVTLATGLHKNAAGQWAKEFSDKDMNLVAPDHPNWERAKKEAIPLSTVMNHDKLDEAYPGLSSQVKLRINPELSAVGSFNPDTNTITLRTDKDVTLGGKKVSAKSIIAHELQHSIQDIEGFPQGSNARAEAARLNNVKEYLENRQETVYNKLLEAEREGAPKAKMANLEEQYDRINEQLQGNYTRAGIEYMARGNYGASAGETEARNVQTRLDMTDEERAAQTPRTTQDVDTKNQIVRFPKGQKGAADPETLGKIARAAVLGTVGATIGMRLAGDDDKWEGALAGAGLAVLAGPILTDFLVHPIESVRRATGNLKQTISAIPKENINDSVSRWQEAGLQSEVSVYRIQKAIERLAPTKASRIRVTNALDKGSDTGLSTGEKAAYKVAREFDDQLGQLGIKEGVLAQLINNHISHIWRNDDKLKAYKELVNSTIVANMSPKTAFAVSRQLKSIAQGKAMGLTPVTEDASQILGIYAKSVLGAIRNKQLLESLKATKDSAGQSYLVMSSKKAPYNYVPINHPQLRGMSVNPTIAPELKNVFYTYDMGPVQTALSTMNMALKRSQVSFSLFHLTSLMDAFTGGMPTFTRPIKTVGTALKSSAGKSDFHKALEGKADPGTQQLFDRFLASGARPQIARGSGADVDLNNNYYEGLQHIQDYMDRALPLVGKKLPEWTAKASHAMDHIIFENGMSGMKFALWQHAVQKINESWAKEAQVKPSTKVPAQAEIDKMAGGYVNNLLGSQNWLQAAQQATSKFGQTWLNALGSPIGRKLSQYLIYAPDWTTSTAMSFTKALGKGSEQLGVSLPGKFIKGIEGLRNPKTVADLHRIYQIRSAALYAVIGGAINYAYSGHYLWDNKDPTTIDLGNGQRLQWNKHWMEPYQIMAHPIQSVINKMGILPREAIEQIVHKEYINTSGYSPDMKDRLAHAAKTAVPIPFQGLSEQTPQQLMWNLAGRNVLGHDTSDPGYKAAQHKKRRQAAEKAAQTRLNKIMGGG